MTIRSVFFCCRCQNFRASPPTSYSRFYAKPIAALVTAQGRESLQRTVDLSENQLGLEVIYGDTDSVMINTHSTDLKQASVFGRGLSSGLLMLVFGGLGNLASCTPMHPCTDCYCSHAVPTRRANLWSFNYPHTFRDL